MNPRIHRIVTRNARACLFLLITAGSLFSNATARAAEAGVQKKTPVEENIFTRDNVMRIQVTIPEGGLKSLRETQGMRFGGGGGESKRPTAKCTVKEGGKEYHDVSVHLKGVALYAARPVFPDFSTTR